MNFTNLITKLDNLNKPVTQLKEVKTNALSKETDVKTIKHLSGLTESAVQECGMSPMGMPHSPPVTMNVSVNASGKESIRDLLDILKGADLNGGDTTMSGPAGVVVGLGGDGPEGHDMHDSPVDDLIKGHDEDDNKDHPEVEIGEENLANEPDEMYAEPSSVTPTGNDIHSHADNEVEKVNGGGNPYASLSEQLKQQLSSLYTEVKSR